MSEAKKLIRNLHGTCAVFLKNTLPDEPNQWSSMELKQLWNAKSLHMKTSLLLTLP